MAWLKKTKEVQWDTENSDSKNSEFFPKITFRIRKFRSRKNRLSKSSESNFKSDQFYEENNRKITDSNTILTIFTSHNNVFAGGNLTELMTLR